MNYTCIYIARERKEKQKECETKEMEEIKQRKNSTKIDKMIDRTREYVHTCIHTQVHTKNSDIHVHVMYSLEREHKNQDIHCTCVYSPFLVHYQVPCLMSQTLHHYHQY